MVLCPTFLSEHFILSEIWGCLHYTQLKCMNCGIVGKCVSDFMPISLQIYAELTTPIITLPC